jgi:cation diffusion facilitator CzcD-associated flavoprotein CzcO
MGSLLPSTLPLNIKKICIIGSGPTGLTAAKYLLAEKAFSKVDIYEEQSEVGGVWHFTPPQQDHVKVPQTQPETAPDKPIWPEDGGAPIFSNPMYEQLNTNIPKDIMKFSDKEFEKDSLLFPTRQDVQKYLLEYAEEVRHLIRFSMQVESVKQEKEGAWDRWRVTSNSLITKARKEEMYDAIVVASGHYTVAFIPDTKNIKEFDEAYPGVVSHAKTYRSSATFKNKKVIVVGSGPSGLDIGTQISYVCRKPLLNSVRTPSSIQFGQEDKEEVPPIVEYLSKSRGVRFADGREEHNIDAIVYCTGYLYSYPFLKSIKPPFVTDGGRARGLYRQLFSIAHPTIAFTALSQRIIPFPLSEVQSAAIAKVWSNKLDLPPVEEQWELERKQVEELGGGKSFHLLPYPKDANYINSLYEWAESARDEFKKQPPYWGAKECWIRERFGKMRKAFVDGGKKAKTMEELGFRFEDGSSVEHLTEEDPKEEVVESYVRS